MHIFWGRVLVNATRSMNRELNQNCYLTFLMFSYIKNGSRLPDSRSTRSERENCFLTLSGCDKVRRSRFHLVAATYRDDTSFDRLWPEWNPIVGVVRRFVLLRENNERSDNAPRPRLENRPALSPTSFSSTCLDLLRSRPTASGK